MRKYLLQASKNFKKKPHLLDEVSFFYSALF